MELMLKMCVNEKYNLRFQQKLVFLLLCQDTFAVRNEGKLLASYVNISMQFYYQLKFQKTWQMLVSKSLKLNSMYQKKFTNCHNLCIQILRIILLQSLLVCKIVRTFLNNSRIPVTVSTRVVNEISRNFHNILRKPQLGLISLVKTLC